MHNKATPQTTELFSLAAAQRTVTSTPVFHYKGKQALKLGKGSLQNHACTIMHKRFVMLGYSHTA
jgi:hypothetical protein